MKKSFGKKGMVASVCMALVITSAFAGCGAMKGESADVCMENEAYYEADNCAMEEPMMATAMADMKAADNYSIEESYEAEDYGVSEYDGAAGAATTTASETTVNTPTSQKIIKTINLMLETEEFDKMMSGIENKINTLGGYVEMQYTYNGSAYDGSQDKRYATMTARIPENKLNDFVNDVSAESNVISKNTSTENVTLAYVDIESRKKMLLAEQESYLALLEKAETVEDITYLTMQLTDVRYQIESMESQLRTYDNLVEYATVNLQIEEVEVYTPAAVEEPEKTRGQLISEGFMKNLAEIGNSFVTFGMNFVINLPHIIMFLIWCGVIFGAIRLIIFIIKRMVKKAKAKATVKKANLLQTQNAAIEVKNAPTANTAAPVENKNTPTSK